MTSQALDFQISFLVLLMYFLSYLTAVLHYSAAQYDQELDFHFPRARPITINYVNTCKKENQS